MLFRAIFWIGLVAVLMPREPDLGFGRPNDSGSLQAKLSNAASAAIPSVFSCSSHQESCSVLPGILGIVKSSTLRSLALVKADIKAQEHRNSAQSRSRALD